MAMHASSHIMVRLCKQTVRGNLWTDLYGKAAYLYLLFLY